jgi:recombinational DNA repair protein RecR
MSWLSKTQGNIEVYHVLGGKISPIDGVGPSQLRIGTLVEKVKAGSVNEVIFALSSTMEGDTTNFYIYKQIADSAISTIARGIAVGDELEYADEVTLGEVYCSGYLSKNHSKTINWLNKLLNF